MVKIVRDTRIKQYMFSIGSLTADSNGRFNIYSDHTINGTVKNVVFFANNYTAAGSIILFSSGLGNSGTGLNERIIKIAAGSANQTFYPFDYGVTGSITTGSPYSFVQYVMHAPLRIVGSGLGASTSGLGLIINYI